ncbi:hypothetical protein Gotur_016772 [Gossypium turneri]
MGGGHGGSTTYKGVTLHHPKRWHVVTGKGLCAVMWFWVLYRAKQDGPVVLVGSFSFQLVGDTLGRAMMSILMAMETSISDIVFSCSLKKLICLWVRGTDAVLECLLFIFFGVNKVMVKWDCKDSFDKHFIALCKSKREV